MTQKTLVKKLTQSRKSLGLTQEDLAQRTGVPRTTIAKIEAGFRNTTLETLKSLAQGVGLDVDLVKKISQDTRQKLVRQLETLNLITINQRQIQQNYEYFQHLLPDKEIWPVIKANAYGHGLKEIVQIVTEFHPTYLVVDSYHEALQVWQVAPHQKVLLIGAVPAQNLELLNLEKTTLTIYTLESLQKLASLKIEATIHLKINTGMNRQGCLLKDLPDFMKVIQKNPQLKVEGVYSHLAKAGDKDQSANQVQFKIFQQAVNQLQSQLGPIKYLHLSATDGALNFKEDLTNAVRLGRGLYTQLAPALELTSQLVNLIQLKKGDQVGYDYTFTAPGPMTLGVIPLGYSDFLDRRLSNLGVLSYHGQPVPIVGRISMNLTTVDLSSLHSPPKLGEAITVISANPQNPNSIAHFSQQLATIEYETMTKINASIRRKII